ncbi:MAG: DUF5658 family protein [Planctomycetota bacterium]
MDTKSALFGLPMDDVKLRWACWFAALNVLDGMQTTALVSRFGAQAEFNPWIAWCIENYSYLGLWGVKFAIMGVVFLAISRVSISILRSVSLGLAAIVSANFVTLINRF